MADETTASVIPLHQVPPKRKAKTAAERAKAYRRRKQQSASPATVAETEFLSAAALKPSIEGLVPEPATRRHRPKQRYGHPISSGRHGAKSPRSS